MIAAIIDCGTNTFNLLIAEIQTDGDYNVILNTKKSVKLGEGGMAGNRIAQKPFERGYKAFLEFVALAEKHQAETIQAFATSAIRSSLNGPDFVKRILEKTGVIIQVLNGDTEAQYIFKGVNLAMGDAMKPMLIMDIGGGSTEFIIAENNQVLWKKSFELGASRLLETFKPSDPVSHDQVISLKEHLKEVLQPLNSQMKKHQINTLVGCSGSFESLADMIETEKNGKKTYNRIYTFNIDELKAMHRKLLSSTEAERKSMPGLVEYRVDTIVFASIFIRHIKKRFKLDEIFYSSYALKEGVLADLMARKIAI